MKRSVWIALGIAGVVVVGLCLVCLLGTLVALGSGDAMAAVLGQDHVVLRLPKHDPSSDLALLRLGQPLERAHMLAQGVDPAAAVLYRQQDGLLQIVGNAQYGGFVPGTSFLLVQYEQDGKTHLDHVRLRTGRPSPVLETFATLQAVVLDDGSILLKESTGTRQRCYRWRSGAQIERLARGDECLASRDGFTLVVADRSDRGLTLTASGTDGSDAVLLLEDREGVVSFQLSADGSRLAFVHADENGQQQLIVLSRQDGSPLFESDAFVRIAGYGFAPTDSALYFVAETDDVDLVLYAVDGEAHRLAQAPGLAAAFSPKAESLVYLITDEAGGGTLFVHPMAGGEDVEVVRGEGLRFAILPSPELILILDQVEDEIVVYSADTDGRGLVELFNDAGLARAEAWVIPGEPWLYLVLTDARGGHALFFSPLERPNGRILMEDYDALLLLNRSPRTSSVLIAAREEPDDAMGLYRLATDARSEPVLLDEDFEEILNATFTRNARQVIYTALSRPDEPEVRRLPADGGTAERLYSDAALLDIQWGRLAPFADSAITFQGAQVVTSFCPGARVIRLGESLEGALSPSGQACYRLILAEPAEVAVAVRAEGETDLVAAVHDRAGTELAEDDDSGPGLNPRLHLNLEAAGSYFIVIRGYSPAASGHFSLTVSEYEVPNLQQAAHPLPVNERVRGVITAADELYLEPYDAFLYGVLYAFQAQANDWAEVEVRAGSIGSSLHPIVLLLDPSFETVAYGEPDNADDARLTYSIAEGGRYYALVTSQDEDYGTEAEYFFDISLSLGTPPEPSGGTIAPGQTVRGVLVLPGGDNWTFGGIAGQVVTISMSGDFDTYLELRGPDGGVLISDDDSGGNLQALISGFTLPQTGTYTIAARSFGRDVGLSYTLRLE